MKPMFRRLTRAVVLVCLLTVCCYGGWRVWQIVARRQEYVWRQAQTAIAQGEHERAEIYLRQLLQQDAAFHPARMALLDLYRRTSDDGEADPRVTEHLTLALDHRPDDVELRDRLVKILSDQDRLQPALEQAAIAAENGSRSKLTLRLATRQALANQDYQLARERLAALYEQAAERSLSDIVMELQILKTLEEPDEVQQLTDDTVTSISRLDRWSIENLEADDRTAMTQFLMYAIATAQDEEQAHHRLTRGLIVLEYVAVHSDDPQAKAEAGDLAVKLLSTVNQRYPFVEAAQGDRLEQQKSHLIRFERIVRRSVESGTASAEVHRWHALVANWTGEPDKVLERIRHGIQMLSRLDEPQRAELMTLHALAAEELIRRGQLTSAEAEVDVLLKSTEMAATGHVLRATIALNEQRFADAERGYLAAMDVQDQQAEATSAIPQVGLLRCSMGQQNWPRVIELATEIHGRLQSLSPGELQWMERLLGPGNRLPLVLGAAYLMEGQDDLAKPFLDQATRGGLESDVRQLQARLLLQRGQTNEAVTVIRTARVRDPDSLPLARLMSQLYESQGQIPAGERVLSEFAKRNPHELNAHIEFIRFLHRNGQTAQAIAAVRHARRILPDQVLLHAMQCDLLINSGNFKLAAAEIKSLGQRPEGRQSAELLSVRLALGEQGFGEAADLLSSVSDDAARTGVASVLKAQIATGEERWGDAAEAYTQALRHSGLQSTARRALIATIGRLVDSEGAEEADRQLQRLIQQTPDEPLLWMIAGHVSMKKAAWDEALERFSRVEQLRTADSGATWLKAQLLTRLGRMLEAADSLKRLFELRPDHVPGHRLAITVHHALSQPDRALFHARRALNLGDDSELTWLAEAEQLAILGRGSEAIASLQQRLEESPESIGTRRLLARILHAAGESEQALRTLNYAASEWSEEEQFSLQSDRIHLLCEAQRWDEAHAVAYRLVRSESDGQASLQLAQLFRRQKWFPAARFYLQHAQKSATDELAPRLQLLKAQIALDQGIAEQKGSAFVEAGAEFERVLDTDPSNIVALNNLAWLYLTQLSETERGIALAEQLHERIAADRLNPAVGDTLVTAYLAGGRGEQARMIADSLLTRFPDSALSHFLWATVAAESSGCGSLELAAALDCLADAERLDLGGEYALPAARLKSGLRDQAAAAAFFDSLQQGVSPLPEAEWPSVSVHGGHGPSDLHAGVTRRP